MRTKLLAVFCFTTLLIFLTFGCNKKDQGHQSSNGLSPQVHYLNKPLIQEAQQWFILRKPNILGEKVAARTYNFGDYKVQWDSASTLEDENFEIVECPVWFVHSPGFKMREEKQSEDSITPFAITKLIVLKSKLTDSMHSVFMNVVSADDNVINISYKSENSHFTGYVFFTTLRGEFINGWAYRDGKIVRQSSGEPSAGKAKAPTEGDNGGEKCYVIVTTWYIRDCIEYYNGYTTCGEWNYLETTYQNYCLYTGGGGGSGGSGGYDDTKDPESNLNGIESICKKSFSFNKYIETSNGVGGWQVAGVKNIHMNIVDFSTGNVVILPLPPIYFGLPVVRSNGDFYSTSTASGIAADAVEWAEQKVMEYYHSIGGSLNVVGMTTYYRNKINEYMQTKGGSAGLSPGSFTNVPLTEAVYSGFFGFNCN